MEIKQQDDAKKGRFFAEINGKIEGEMTYVWTGAERIIIDHTEVSEALKGQSVGKKLVHEAVVFAREKHLKILPLCPFAKHVFNVTPDYSDVLF